MGFQLPHGRPRCVHGQVPLIKASFEDLDLRGRRVLLREDLNVPMEGGRITDETRIRAAQPTIARLREMGARVLVASHLGRPPGPDASLSLAPIAKAMGVPFVSDCVGPEAEKAAAALADGEAVLLENLRFHPGEEANDPGFAKNLAALAEVYINDAFACSHRAHASVVGVAEFLPAYAGLLMLDELEALHRALDEPRRPLIAIVGGAKVSTKAGLLRHLLPKVQYLIVCGAMANTFFKARGADVAASLVEDSALEEARKVEKEAGDKLLLPVDTLCAQAIEEGAPTRVSGVNHVEQSWMILDIGPRSMELFRDRLRGAGTVVWNGPAGVFEVPQFSRGTRALGEAILASGAYSLVGGGDTAAAVEKLGLHGFSHVSTGGGATLEYLEGATLPGVAVLKDAESA